MSGGKRNFSDAECFFIIDQFEKFRTRLSDPITPSTVKVQIWEEITKNLNDALGSNRNYYETRKKWGNLTYMAQKYVQMIKNGDSKQKIVSPLYKKVIDVFLKYDNLSDSPNKENRGNDNQEYNPFEALAIKLEPEEVSEHHENAEEATSVSDQQDSEIFDFGNFAIKFETGSTDENQKKRKPNFSGQETDLLLDYVEKNSELLVRSNGQTNTCESNNLKQTIWSEITEGINKSFGHVERSVIEIRKKWMNLVGLARKDAAKNSKDGRPIPLTSERVISIHGGLAGLEAFEGQSKRLTNRLSNLKAGIESSEDASNDKISFESFRRYSSDTNQSDSQASPFCVSESQSASLQLEGSEGSKSLDKTVTVPTSEDDSNLKKESGSNSLIEAEKMKFVDKGEAETTNMSSVQSSSQNKHLLAALQRDVPVLEYPPFKRRRAGGRAIFQPNMHYQPQRRNHVGSEPSNVTEYSSRGASYIQPPLPPHPENSSNEKLQREVLELEKEVLQLHKEKLLLEIVYWQKKNNNCKC